MKKFFMKYSVLLMVVFSCLSFTVFAEEFYLLGPGDKVAIKVFGEDDLTIETLLGDDGAINYPFLGEITLVGMTIKELEQLIEQGVKGDYLVNPNVYAQVIEYRPFYIHGEVNEPGSYPYQPGMTINQAIALAGGLTERADMGKISIFKEREKDKKQQASLDYKVNAGDTVTIEQRFF